MTRYVVDTNVPIVANGRPEPQDNRPPSLDCRIAAVAFLQTILTSGTVIVDLAGAIQAEYRNLLNASGQPGVGDRFYQEVLHSSPQMIERVELPTRDDGEYADLPQGIIDANFDRGDRKFAALAKLVDAPVANAIDGDWLNHRAILEDNGIHVQFVCGCDPTKWFAA
jgi:hypothetical protein